MEQLDITVQIAQPSVASYTVLRLNLSTTPPCIDVTVADNVGKQSTFTYNNAVAATLLTALNRGNFTVTSLQKAVINRLVADGFLPAGSVSGTPQ